MKLFQQVGEPICQGIDGGDLQYVPWPLLADIREGTGADVEQADTIAQP